MIHDYSRVVNKPRGWQPPPRLPPRYYPPPLPPDTYPKGLWRALWGILLVAVSFFLLGIVLSPQDIRLCEQAQKGTAPQLQTTIINKTIR